MRINLRKSQTLVMGAVICSVSQLALAEDLPSQAVSTASNTSVFKQITEHSTLSYMGIFHGGPLNNPGSGMQPDVDGNLDPSSPLNFENYVTAAYKIDKNTLLGAMAHFYYFPVGKPTGTGHDLQMLDPSIVLQRNNIIDKNGFRLTGKLFVTLPITTADYSRPHHVISAISPTINLSYDVPTTNLTLGLFSYLRAYIPGSGAPDDVRTWRLIAAPYLNYQFTKNFAGTIWVDLIQATRNKGTHFFGGLQNDVVDIEPGFNWDITKNISINPYLNIYPAHPTIAATSFQAVITAKAF